MLDGSAIVFFLAISYAIINYVRGRGMIPHYEHVVAPIAWAIVTFSAAFYLGYPLAYMLAIAIVTFIGTLIWMIGLWKGWGGWGLYFAAWTWTWNPNDHEVPLIDYIGLKLVPFQTAEEHWTNGLRGVICMSLRGLYILPFFFMLSAPGFGLAVGLSQGIVYGAMRWLAPKYRGTEFAEPAFAFLIGLAAGYKLLEGF